MSRNESTSNWRCNTVNRSVPRLKPFRLPVLPPTRLKGLREGLGILNASQTSVKNPLWIHGFVIKVLSPPANRYAQVISFKVGRLALGNCQVFSKWWQTAPRRSGTQQNWPVALQIGFQRDRETAAPSTYPSETVDAWGRTWSVRTSWRPAPWPARTTDVGECRSLCV